MCGITGIFDTRGSRPEINRATLQRMNDSQLHRGPDEGRKQKSLPKRELRATHDPAYLEQLLSLV